MGMTLEELRKRRCDWLPEAFDAFWTAYPRKESKVYAMVMWDRMRLPESEIPELMAFLEECKDSNKWRNPDYIDFAGSFLHDQEWIR